MRVLEVQMNCIFAIIPVNKLDQSVFTYLKYVGEGEGKGGSGRGAEICVRPKNSLIETAREADKDIRWKFILLFFK